MDSTITFTVNGQSRTVTTDPQRPLLDVLREDLKLTGTKYGCGEGQCRACTVLVNGKSVASCVTPVADADKAGSPDHRRTRQRSANFIPSRRPSWPRAPSNAATARRA